MTEKSEKQKILDGEVHTVLDPELNADRERCRILQTTFNAYEDWSEESEEVLRDLVGHLGQHVRVDTPMRCNYGYNIFIDDFSSLSFNCGLLDVDKIYIGKHVKLGPNCQIYTVGHPLNPYGRRGAMEIAKPIRIEDDVWLGGCSKVCPGVTIGRGAVIGAGSVVVKDVPPFTVYAGAPAKFIKNIDTSEA